MKWKIWAHRPPLDWRVVTHWKGWKLLSSLCTCRSFHQFVRAEANCLDWINNFFCHIYNDSISELKAFQTLFFVHFELYVNCHCIIWLDSSAVTTFNISFCRHDWNSDFTGSKDSVSGLLLIWKGKKLFFFFKSEWSCCAACQLNTWGIWTRSFPFARKEREY